MIPTASEPESGVPPAITFTPEFLARFRVLGELGQGGMGRVLEGVQISLERRVAIKVLAPQLAVEPFLTRFEAEARLAAKLFHSHLVAVIESGIMGGLPYIIFELVEGQNLRELLKREGGLLSVARSLELVRQAADGLEHAHQAGIIHRDVKPDNLLVTRDGVLKVADFGVAREHTSPSATRTQAGVIVGTPFYMSPEQARELPLTPSTDVYSLVVVLFELLAGEPPFAGQSALDLLHQHVHADPPALPDDVPAAVAALVRRGLSKEPTDRYESMAALSRAIAQLLAAPDAGAAAPRRHAPTARVAVATTAGASATQVSRSVTVATGAVRSAAADPRRFVLAVTAMLVALFTLGAARTWVVPQSTPAVEGTADPLRRELSEVASHLKERRLEETIRLLAPILDRDHTSERDRKELALARDRLLERLELGLVEAASRGGAADRFVKPAGEHSLALLVAGVFALVKGEMTRAYRALDALDDRMDASRAIPTDMNAVRVLLTMSRLAALPAGWRKRPGSIEKTLRTLDMLVKYMHARPEAELRPLGREVLLIAAQARVSELIARGLVLEPADFGPSAGSIHPALARQLDAVRQAFARGQAQDPPGAPLLTAP